MSGIEVIVSQMVQHKFTDLAQGSNTDKTLGPIFLGEIDTSQYREGTLEVLITESTIPAGSSILILAMPIVRSSDAPGVAFGNPNGVGVASVTLDSTPTPSEVPSMLRDAFDPNFGPLVTIAMLVTAGANNTGTFTATFQVNVSLKN